MGSLQKGTSQGGLGPPASRIQGPRGLQAGPRGGPGQNCGFWVVFGVLPLRLPVDRGVDAGIDRLIGAQERQKDERHAFRQTDKQSDK